MSETIKKIHNDQIARYNALIFKINILLNLKNQIQENLSLDIHDKVKIINNEFFQGEQGEIVQIMKKDKPTDQILYKVENENGAVWHPPTNLLLV